MHCPSCSMSADPGLRECPGCHASLPLGPGALVAGRFELIASLGAGGMGTVFRARDRRLDVEVALKVLRVGRDPQAVHRFHSEVRLARRVRHRNVCGVHEYGEDGEVVFCVMELVSGRNLGQRLREAPFAWERAFEIAIDAAAGLEAIHEAGIVHRDVKPANIMIDDRGEVRLVDFGIAKPQADDSHLDARSESLTEGHHVVGSAEYMSPEQIKGGALDARSDVYSFAIVVYEIFSGLLPFRGQTVRDVMLSRLEQPPCFDEPAAATLPPALVPVLQKALQKEPAARQQSMGELIRELGEAARAAVESRTEVIAVERDGGGRRDGRGGVRGSLTLILAGGSAAAVAFFAWTTLVPPRVTVRVPEAATPTARPLPALVAAADPKPRTAPSTEAERRAARGARLPQAASRLVSLLPSPGAAPLAVPQQSTDGGLTAASAPVPRPPAARVEPAAEPEPQGAAPPPATPTPAAPSPLTIVPPHCVSEQIRYCPQTESLRVEGRVLVDLMVDEHGRVSDVRLVRWDDGLLRDCALRAARRLRCEPARRGDTPVAMRRSVLVDFRLPR